MPHPKLRAVAVVALIAVVVALASCSGSNDDSAPTAKAPTTKAGGTTTTSPPAIRPVASAGCEKAPAAAASDMRHDLTVAGLQRWFLLTAPKGSGDNPLPLVVDFHGLAEGASVHTQMSQMGTLGAKDGFVVAFPNGQGEGLGVRWNAGPGSDPTKTEDSQFVTKMLDTIEAERCIDTTRVYASGLSQGAFMASLMACTMSDRFAAIAAVAGLQKPDDCHPGRPVPVLAFHGTADPILKFNGGIDVSALGGVLNPGAGGQKAATTTTTTAPADLDGPGYPANVRAWAANNGCDSKPTDNTVGKETVHRVYHCPAGADVEFYIIKGGGHAWPGSKFSQAIASIVGYTTFDIDATALIWSFLGHFRRAPS